MLQRVRRNGGVKSETFYHVPLHTFFSCKIQCSFHFLFWFWLDYGEVLFLLLVYQDQFCQETLGPLSLLYLS